MPHRKRSLYAILAAGACALTLAAGCSSSSSGSTSPSAKATNATSASGSGSGSGADTAAYTKLLDSAGEATRGSLPSTPVTPKTGVNVWDISCGQTAAGCADQSSGVKNAVASLAKYGWKYTLYDTKLDPSNYPTGITQAIAGHADIIVLGAIDCKFVAPQLKQAISAGIKIVSMQAYDCNDPSQGGGSPLFTSTVNMGPNNESLATTAQFWGQLQAAWAIQHTNGQAKVVLFYNPGSTIQTYTGKGFIAEMKKCSGCKIEQTIDFQNSDLGPGLVQKVSSTLLRNPDANILSIPLDPGATLASQAIKSAGKQSKVALLGALGDAPNIGEIRSGGPQQMDIGVDETWMGWIAVDQAARLSAGKPVVYSGYGTPFIDKAHNLPKGDSYDAANTVPYQSNYKKLWGVG